MAPGTFAVLAKSRKRLWKWNIPLQDNASNMADLHIRLYLQRRDCCCDGYAACLEVNQEIRERVVCESPTWFQPIGGKGELFCWREGGHNFEIWYNNVRVHTEAVHLFIDGIEWETKLPFDQFWKSFAVCSFWWALGMLLLAGGCLGVGILYFVAGIVISSKFCLFLVGFVISLILAFIQCFVGVALLIRRPGRSTAENSTGVSSSDHKVLVDDDELQNRHGCVTAMTNIA